MKTELINKIQSQINEGNLPGTPAHDKMRPRLISGPKANFNKDLDQYKKASILIALYPDEDTLVFPLIERTHDGTVHSGQIAFPGGRKETKETDLACALRETNEELGINTDYVNVFGKLSLTPIPPSQYIVTPFIGQLDKKPQFCPCKKEVKDYFSVSMNELHNKDNFKKLTRPHRGAIYEIPYIELNSKMVWGATAMILYELKMIIESI